MKNNFFFCAPFLFLFLCAPFAVYSEEKLIFPQGSPAPVSPLVAIDSSKSYTLTLRLKGDAGSVNVYLWQYNKKRQRIGPYHVSGNTASLTELPVAALKGARKLIIKDGSKWLPPEGGRYIIAFNAKEDLSDLPNFDIDYYFTTITKLDDGTWQIDMGERLRASHPAGTKVRQHYDGDHLNCGICPLPAAAPFSRKIAPMAGIGSSNDRWWLGTAYVQLVLRVNGSAPVTLIDWSLTETVTIQNRDQRTTN